MRPTGLGEKSRTHGKVVTKIYRKGAHVDLLAGYGGSGVGMVRDPILGYVRVQVGDAV